MRKKWMALAVVLSLALISCGDSVDDENVQEPQLPPTTEVAPGGTATPPSENGGVTHPDGGQVPGGDTQPGDQPETTPEARPEDPSTGQTGGLTPIQRALRTGDASPLTAPDMPTLLNMALQSARSVRQQQQTLVADLIDAGTAAPLEFTNNSQNIRPLLATSASPLLVADSGNVLASISTANGGRAVGYGKNLLSQLATPQGSNQAHLPMFTRVFTWLVTGQARGSLPPKVRFVAQNTNANAVNSFIARLGSTGEKIDCNLTAADNTCWQGADILLFGPGAPKTDALSALVRSYLAAGKGVLFLHENWTESGGDRTILEAMGMRLGDYPGNFYAGEAGTRISADRDAAQQRAVTDHLAGRVAALEQLAGNTAVDFSKDTALVGYLDSLRSDLATMEGRAIDIFTADYTEKAFMDMHRAIVLWADMYRQGVDYSQVRRSNGPEFFRTLAADSLSFAVRGHELPPRSFGDWMPASAPSLQPSAQWEDIDVTIAQGSGRTLIGRGAVPGKPVQVQVVDAAGAQLGLRVGNIRARGNPLGQENYTRPRYPDGHYAGIPANGTLSYVTAWGGPLMLDYSKATAGTVVKLRVRGGLKYAHFDFTQNPSRAELDEAVGALQRADFGWQTAKFVGGEIQQTIGYAKSAIGNRDPEDYVQVRLRDMIFNSNHLANGYNNMPMSANVASVCAALGWDCNGNVHRAPGVQHFVGWIATCGFLCSGNPSDGSTSVSPGWGWWHELGHNTVPKVMTLTFSGRGCGVECNNNILANASAMRQYALTNGAENNNGDSVNHKSLYQMMAQALGAGKTGSDLQSAVHNSLWMGGDDQAMRAVHFQLAFIYTRLRLGLALPNSDDTLDFLGLISRGNRLIDNTWSEASKASLGMGRYTSQTITNHDMLYVLSSRIIGRDMRPMFEMYGIALDEKALGSIADLQLPLIEPMYYALPRNQGNKVGQGQWLSLKDGVAPAYPF